MTDLNDLNDRLLAAHTSGDTAALVPLYTQAADAAASVDAACFFLTHAYIFALEQDHPDTDKLRAHLVKHGRA